MRSKKSNKNQNQDRNRSQNPNQNQNHQQERRKRAWTNKKIDRRNSKKNQTKLMILRLKRSMKEIII